MNIVSLNYTKSPAFDSPDHIQPWGTARDNSTSAWFNRKLLWWLGSGIESLKILDLGCAGGGFVKSLRDADQVAIGLEGSDYSRKRNRAEWATIPELLFVADATEPFQFFYGQDRMQFNVITAWEFIEHIQTDKIPAVMGNIERHLKLGGLVIMSISPNEEIINGTVLHQTVKPREWWLQKFRELGFTHHDLALRWFGDDFVRDRFNASGSFHVVLTRCDEQPPRAARLRFLIRGFRFARAVKRALCIPTPSLNKSPT